MLYIRDPTGHLTPAPGGTRSQLTSSADLAALLPTIGTGNDGWRSDSRYSHLANRGGPALDRPCDGRHVGRGHGDAAAVADGAEDIRHGWAADGHPRTSA